MLIKLNTDEKIILCILIFISCNAFAQFSNNGLDFLTPANFNYPVRQQLWILTGDDPFVNEKDIFKIELSYNYSSAEKYFDPAGETHEIKKSYFQYNKGSDQGGYFRKTGAILTGQYHWKGLNKVIIRFPFTFTEMKSYSSTTDVKPQEEFIKPRGPFQDLELSYERKVSLSDKFSFYAGGGLTIPSSRPKRYLDNPQGGYGNTWTNNLNMFLSYAISDWRFTGGAKYIITYPHTEQLFTPRPYGIGYPFQYDTTSITFNALNAYIEQNPYEATIKAGSLVFADFVADYFFKFGLDASLQFQYFYSSGDKFDQSIPVKMARVNGSIEPVGYLSELEGGYSGTIRLYLTQDFAKISKSNFSFTLGFGSSVFGSNAQGEANIILGLIGIF